MTQPAVRLPRYLTRFRCLGSRCEDNCCAGWQHVDVDAASFAAYRRLDHPELGPALRQHVIPNDDPAATPDEHALIAIPDGGCCPFFTPEGLCAIQRELGEALLPTGCDTFPRQATLVDDTLEVAGGFSCPEVVRLALLAPDALDLLEVEPDRRLAERGRYWVETPWPDRPVEGDPRRHYHPIRHLCLDLLRRPDVSLEARLQALGGALEQLDALPSPTADQIEPSFASATARLPTLQQAIEAAPPRPTGPPELLLRRLRPWIAMAGLPPRYRACLDRLRDGLRLPTDPAAPIDPATARAYSDGLALLRTYLERRPYALEHALLNRVLVGTFPFHPQHTFFEEYAILACRHALLKLHLVGAAAAGGELTDELLVETVQAFDKYPDSPDYWRRTLNLLRQESSLNQAGLAALLTD